MNAFIFDRPTGQYKPAGRAGVTIAPAKSDEGHGQHLLVLYRSKQETLATVPIGDKLSFDCQSATYGTFPDAQGKTWAVNFPSTEALETFATRLAVIKFKHGCSGATVLQSLPPSKGEDKKSKPVLGQKVLVTYSSRLVGPEDGLADTVDQVGSVEITLGNENQQDKWKSGLLSLINKF